MARYQSYLGADDSLKIQCILDVIGLEIYLPGISPSDEFPVAAVIEDGFHAAS